MRPVFTIMSIFRWSGLRPRGLWIWIVLFCASSSWFSACTCSSRGGLDGHTKILRKVSIGKGKSFDPHRQFDSQSSEVVALLFDSLFTTHYLKRPLEFVPNLAASMPVFSDGGKTMTIALRTDVKFQDGDCFPNEKGREFVARDVIYSMTRFADPFINENSYSLLEGLIVGLDAARKSMEKLGDGNYTYDQFPVEGLKAIDDHTVQIKLTRPTLVPMQVMAKTVTSIVPRECVDKYGEDFQFHPLGTGAFHLEYTNRLGDIWAKKNPDYHLVYPSEGAPGDKEKGLLADAGKRLPLIDEVYVPVIEESQPALLKFLRGYFDWVGMDSDSFQRMAINSGPGKFELKEQYKKEAGLYIANEASSFWIAINMKNEILGSNLKLRQAIAMAYDRQGYIDDVLNGRGVVLDTIVPATLPSSHSELGFHWYERNVEAAKVLLAEAGYPGGKGLPEFNFVYYSGATAQRTFEYQRRNLAEIGVKIKLDLMPYSSYLKKVDEGDFDLTLTGWLADYPDPENFTSLITSIARGQGQNYGNWHNKRYDELSDLTKLTPPGAERNKLFAEMAELVKEDIPVIPMFGVIRVGILSKNWLRNFKRDVEADREAIFVDIDQAKQKEGFSL